MIKLYECNPFLRAALMQDAVMEGVKSRRPYDNRIFFVYSGDATIILNDNEIPVSKNTLIFLSPRDVYRFKGKIRAAVFNFDMTTACYERKVPICPVPDDLYDKTLVFDESVVEEFSQAEVINADETLKRQIDDIVEVFIRKGDFTDEICSAALKKLLIDILIFVKNQKDGHVMLADKVLSYIKANATDIEQNADLGKTFGYHPVYLSEVFKARFKKTLHSAILEEKLLVAARLLTYTDDSIEKIAFKAGLSCRSYFCTAFKKRFGLSPLSYRNKYRIATI